MEKKVKSEIRKLIRNITWRIRMTRLRLKLGKSGQILLAIFFLLIALAPLFLRLMIVWLVIHFIIKWW